MYKEGFVKKAMLVIRVYFQAVVPGELKTWMSVEGIGIPQLIDVTWLRDLQGVNTRSSTDAWGVLLRVVVIERVLVLLGYEVSTRVELSQNQPGTVAEDLQEMLAETRRLADKSLI